MQKKFNYYVLFIRCFALYFPLKMKDKSFKYASRVVPIIGWVVAFLMFTPCFMDKYGHMAVECKSLLCRWISLDDENIPTGYEPEVYGTLMTIIVGVLMLILNVATYIRVRVVK